MIAFAIMQDKRIVLAILMADERAWSELQSRNSKGSHDARVF